MMSLMPTTGLKSTFEGGGGYNSKLFESAMTGCARIPSGGCSFKSSAVLLILSFFVGGALFERLCTPDRRLIAEGKQREERAEVPLQMEQDTLKSQFTPQELDELHTLLVKFEAAFKNTDNAQEAKE